MTNLVERLNASERKMDLPNRRPKDAATLIILDGTPSDPKVLMGRRRRDLAFMPGLFVFPGGRIDPSDARVPVAGDYHPAVAAKLAKSLPAKCGPARVRALAVAAVREAYEEAGILIGSPVEKGTANPHWRAFAERGIGPDLAPMRLVARAITPPRRPRRFDTRFFAVTADAIADRMPIGVAPDGELEEIAWVPLGEAQGLQLPTITLTVLEELGDRLARDGGLRPEADCSFYYWRGKGFVRETL